MDINPTISTVASIIALLTTYAFHREIHPRRRVTFRASIDPLISQGTGDQNGLRVRYGETPIEQPYLVTVTIRSQGKADIQAASFHAQAPIRIDLNTSTYGPLGAPVGRAARDVQLSVEDSSISIGPSQIKRDFYLKFQCLCDGSPRLVARNSLTDIALVDVTTKEDRLAPLHHRLGKAFKWSWYELISMIVLMFLLALIALISPAANGLYIDPAGPMHQIVNYFFIIGFAAGMAGLVISAGGFLVTFITMRVVAAHDRLPKDLAPVP
jgi:hypothetical protein